MTSLRDILRRARTGLEDGWLYLPAHGEWNLETPGMIIDVDKLQPSELDNGNEPLSAIQQGLVATLDSPTIEDIVSATSRSGVEVTDECLLEAFLYYMKHDSFAPL